jgi:large subunit ribosomal protein L17
MRHRKSFNHLGRTSSHRKAMLANMASSLIIHKRIKTTIAKAKELRTYIEPLITKSREDSTHSRRVVFSSLQDKIAVSELFREVAPKVADRPGGYTRILKLENRLGDSAEMCFIELVDFNINMISGKETVKAKAKRRRGTKKTAVEKVADSAVKPDTTVKEIEDAAIVEDPGTTKTESSETPEIDESDDLNIKES